jgi:pyruvate dehydrogenase E2 component (dihydrolipoamide acetyltransferase)
MAEIIRMPKMSDTMTEGVIAAWLKKEGDKVKSGDILAEVETDKATMELENYEDGTLLYVGVKEKDAVPVDGVIAIVGEPGEDISELLRQIKGGGGASAPVAKETNSPQPQAETAIQHSNDTDDSADVDAVVVRMPKMSDTMTEGVIASWLKKVGDTVKSGDILAEVETDKATMELENYEDGTLLYIGAEAGSAVPVDGIIAIIGAPEADYKKLLAPRKQAPQSKPVPVQEKTEAPANSSTSATSVASQAPKTDGASTKGGRVFASPLARKLAEEKGFDINQIKGSGDNGRIVKRDVENFVPTATPAAKATSSAGAAPAVHPYQESFTEVPVSQMRKVIARRLGESKFSAPHFYLTMEINMDKAIEARKSINEVSPVKISFNDMVVKAVAVSLRKHPQVNSSWLGDKIRFNNHVHIGVAVAVDEGLLVPVVRFADSKSLSQISAETKELATKAKNKKLQPSDWEGNTFSISNLGMFGIDEFTAIINPPDACILAVGGIKETPIVKNGQIVPGNVMKVTLSCDHRVVDGAGGSAFLQTLKQLLEDPVRILV